MSSSGSETPITAMKREGHGQVQLVRSTDESPSDVISAVEEINGRERLKRQRSEIAGCVWIPDIWGHEELLKDWIDCSAFDSSLVPNGVASARAALAREGRRARTGGLRTEKSC